MILKHKPLARILILVCIALVGGTVQVAAVTKSDSKTSNVPADSVQAVAQSYGATKALQQGLIVQLDEKNKANVATGTYKNSKKIIGVVVAANAAAVSLSSDSAGQQAYVVTSGRYNVLVSNQNGAISSGDFIGISAIDGIGMKADTVEDSVLGRAVGGFDGKADVISTTSLKTSDGKQIKAAIGSVSVDIAIAPNPTKTSGDSGVPNFVQKIAVSVVGKAISPAQLYASVAILLVGIGVVASLLYGGIQTAMTAIGRNPLAKQSILRNMIQVIVAGLMIFIGCLIAVYLVLKI
jgi:hypothetical protein